MDIPSKVEWISLWKASAGCVYQSWEWIESCQEAGKKPIFRTYREAGVLKAGVVFFENIVATPLGKKKILTAYGTPLALTETNPLALLESIKSTTKEYFYCTIAPLINQSNPAPFFQARYKESSNATILVDLHYPREDLWQRAEKKSVRWGIKTAEKNGLIFSEMADVDEFKKFYQMYLTTTEEGDFNAEKKEKLAALLDKKIGKLFLVKSKDMIVAGALVLIDNNNSLVILNLTSSTEQGRDLQAMPFIYWNLILFAKAEGFHFFDLGGYDLDAKPGEKTYNINKFKERFNFPVVKVPIYSTKVVYPLIRKVIKNLRFIKKLYSKS